MCVCIQSRSDGLHTGNDEMNNNSILEEEEEEEEEGEEESVNLLSQKTNFRHNNSRPVGVSSSA